MSDKHATLENRDGFQSKWGFILACIGSAVGMGNIWRFPIMVSVWGGRRAVRVRWYALSQFLRGFALLLLTSYFSSLG